MNKRGRWWSKKFMISKPKTPKNLTVARSEWLEIIRTLDRLMKSYIESDDELEVKPKRVFSGKTLVMLNEAYSMTLRYYGDCLGGEARDTKEEKEISARWRQTGKLVRAYDSELSLRMTSRPGCWGESATWSSATMQKAWQGLNSIRVSANRMSPDRGTMEGWGKRG
jgi:hypothetical protein